MRKITIYVKNRHNYGKNQRLSGLIDNCLPISRTCVALIGYLILIIISTFENNPIFPSEDEILVH